MSDLGDSLFGSSTDPGMMGTGQQRFDPYNIDREAFGVNAQQMQDRSMLRSYQDQLQKRQAPQMQAAQTDLNQLERTQGVNAQIAQGQAAQLSPAERITAERVAQQNIGQANVYGGATVDPAAQARAAQLGRQDAEFRAGQTGLMSQLQEQAAGRGPSLAAGQLQEASDRTLQQQAGAAAAGGGNATLARRQLAVNAAQQNQQTARDVSQTRMQEQMAARQQLQGVVAGGRSQDIEVANAQAQLQQQTALANQQALNARSAQQAGLSQQAGLAGAEALNARQLQQAQMNMQGNLANQQAGMQAMMANQQYGNQFALQQGQFGQQMNLANLSNQQNAYMQNAQMQQQANLANQQYYNQGMFGNTGFQQQANQGNLQSQLENQAQMDAMQRYYTEAQVSMTERDREARMAQEALKTQQSLGYAGLEQKSYEAARSGKSAMGGMAMGAAAAGIGLLAMSDEDVKGSVTRGGGEIKTFLDQYLQGVGKMANEYASSSGSSGSGNQFMSGAAKGFSMVAGNAGGGAGGMMGGAGGAGGAAGGAGAGGIGSVSSGLTAGGGGAGGAAAGGAGAAGAGAAGAGAAGAGGAGALMGAGGAGAGAGAAAAASDKKAKNLEAENSKLKSVMSGMQSQQQDQGNQPPLVSGFNKGKQMVNDFYKMYKQNNPQAAPPPPQASQQALSNPQASAASAGSNTEYGNALSGARGFEGSPSNMYTTPQTSPEMPGYLGGGMSAPEMSPLSMGDVTWGTPEMYSGSGADAGIGSAGIGGADMGAAGGAGSADMGGMGAGGATGFDMGDMGGTVSGSSREMKDVKPGYSHSPIGGKTGITSGNMQLSNFLSAMGAGGGGGGTPTTYDAMSGGGMDVKGSMANHSAMATAYQDNPSNYSDYAGLMTQGPRSGPSMGATTGMSDKNTKEHIKDALDEELTQFLSTVHPYEYSYKEPQLPGRGYGRFVSPMAQELEKTDLGKSAVKETPQGKMVDYGKLGGVMLASQAFLNERLNELEAKLGKGKGKK